MDDTKTLSEALGDLGFGNSQPIPPIDWDEVDRQALERHKAQRLAGRVAELKSRYPAFEGFDIDHLTLASNRAKCEAVIGWQWQWKGLLMVGEHGTGKTRSAYELAMRLLSSEGVDVAWWTAQDLAGRICEEIDYGADDARRFIEALACRKTLFIDDLGQEEVNGSQNERVQAWILQLIDKRCARGMPLIVTTNRGAKAMYAKYGYCRGGAIARRLAENCEILKFE